MNTTDLGSPASLARVPKAPAGSHCEAICVENRSIPILSPSGATSVRRKDTRYHPSDNPRNPRNPRLPTPRTTSPQYLNCTIAVVPSKRACRLVQTIVVAGALANSAIVPHAGRTDPATPLYSPKPVGDTNPLDRAVKGG